MPIGESVHIPINLSIASMISGLGWTSKKACLDMRKTKKCRWCE